MTNTATVEMIKNIINGMTPLRSKALISAFPVGRVYISVDEVSPASLFGGTWEKIEKKFLYGTGGVLLLAQQAAKPSIRSRLMKCRAMSTRAELWERCQVKTRLLQ